MALSNELKKIKKEYGEDFMHLCRKSFPTILEKEGLLTKILKSTFSNNSKTLYKDIIDNELERTFKGYIYSKAENSSQEKVLVDTDKTPYEILEEAGYDLFECKTEEEIQSFKKYYKVGEELCTFNGGRLKNCIVFFAVKKDVDNIKREDFEEPRREDEYGTSVIGIEFEKYGENIVSIKNRYNHTVNNPDATYGNDLDRIVPGLSKSFSKLLSDRGLELNTDNIEEFEIPGYVVANDGIHYKYNMEINGKYYCPGNIVIENGEAKKIKDSDNKILLDYFLLDLEKKTVTLYDNNISDSFVDDLVNIEKIKVTKYKENESGERLITIQKKNSKDLIKIRIDKDNQIVGYENNSVEKTKDGFMTFNERMKELNLQNLKKAGNDFLKNNKVLKKLEVPNLEETGDNFLFKNENLKELKLFKLRKVGNNFFTWNNVLNKLELPNLIQAGNSFFGGNKALKEIRFPKLKQVGDWFLGNDENLSIIELPELEKTGKDFLYYNKELEKLIMPKLKEVGGFFLFFNNKIKEINLPNLEKVGKSFLRRNNTLKKLILPNLKEAGDWFMQYNEVLDEVILPKLESVGLGFLASCKNFDLGSVKHRENSFWKDNKKINKEAIANLDNDLEINKSKVAEAKEILENLKEREQKQNYKETQ